VQELGLKNADELYEKIGLGERAAPLVARRLLPPAPTRGDVTAGPLAIAARRGLVVTYARCCFPIPNDPILANLSSGAGRDPSRGLWQPCVVPQAAGEMDLGDLAARNRRLFHVEIKIEVSNKDGRARAGGGGGSQRRRRTSSGSRWSSATATRRR
jgi:hypothetical protein